MATENIWKRIEQSSTLDAMGFPATLTPYPPVYIIIINVKVQIALFAR